MYGKGAVFSENLGFLEQNKVNTHGPIIKQTGITFSILREVAGVMLFRKIIQFYKSVCKKVVLKKGVKNFKLILYFK